MLEGSPFVCGVRKEEILVVSVCGCLWGWVGVRKYVGMIMRFQWRLLGRRLVWRDVWVGVWVCVGVG